MTPLSRYRRFVRAAVLMLSLFVGLAETSAFAQRKGDIEDTEMDARLFGYDGNPGIEKSSSTGLWFIYFFLVVVGCAALFKTAKRE